MAFSEGHENIGAIMIYGTIKPFSPDSWLRNVSCQSSTEDDELIEFSINRDDALNMIPHVERQGKLVPWQNPKRTIVTYGNDGNHTEKLWKEYLKSSPDWVLSIIG